MGVVYKARDLHLDRAVAVKVLPAEAVANSDRKRRFVQEAKAASALNHPNIVHIYDIDTTGGVDFIAMEYVEGTTLEALIGRKGLAIPDVLKCGVQIADALAAAHVVGIIHRDIKPGNITVSDKRLVKILDFGLAKLSEPEDGNHSSTTQTMSPRTEEGAIVGTCAYMSPEQANGKKVDAPLGHFLVRLCALRDGDGAPGVCGRIESGYDGRDAHSGTTGSKPDHPRRPARA
jgi:eukaryotic-like serine/threonine-protein kinase